MKYSRSSQPFTHGKAQAPAPTGGRVGGPIGKAPKALGIKNQAGGAGTVGNGGSQGAKLGSMKTPGGAKPK